MTRKSSYSGPAHKIYYNILDLTSSEPKIQSPLYLELSDALYTANIIIADPVFVSKVHQWVIAIAPH